MSLTQKKKFGTTMQFQEGLEDTPFMRNPLTIFSTFSHFCLCVQHLRCHIS